MVTKLPQTPTHIEAHANAFASIWDAVVKNIPLDVLLALIFPRILATIKNPTSAKAKALKTVLVDEAKAVMEKWPEEFA